METDRNRMFQNHINANQHIGCQQINPTNPQQSEESDRERCQRNEYPIFSTFPAIGRRPFGIYS